MDLLVTITLSDRLYELLEDKLPNLGRRVECAVTKELSKQARAEANVAINVAAVPTPPERMPSAAAETETKTEAAPAAEEAPAKPLTLTDMREAMDRTRRRFEGDDYANNTDSEDYKRYHRQLTGMFKQIALDVAGVKKPADMPVEKIGTFIAQLEQLEPDAEGNIVIGKAPL